MESWQLKSPSIEFAVSVFELGQKGDEIEAAVIEFAGVCRRGSRGSVDAFFMMAIRDYVINCVQPSALVFDLADLEYTWGNTIWGLFLIDEPFATIVSEKCSGFQGCGVAEPTFGNLEDACEHLRPLAIEYNAKLNE